MRTSQYLLSTLKEIPTDAEIISHQLMLRSGMIRRLASGIYIWLPTGLRVLRKIENIIREEMNKTGAVEVSLPIIQPANLWKKSGRWTQYGEELLRLTDRNKRLFLLGPTHEEVITYFIRNELSSYKELPLNIYQIQTKFRDEIRPRFGIIRSREFLMKDAYSFHIDQMSLQITYDIMYQTYNNIFTRLGLKFYAVIADTGSIGGNISHEFQALTNNGEDNIAFSTESNYAANIDLASTIYSTTKRSEPKEKMRLINILSSIHNANELVTQISKPLEKTVKTLLVHAKKNTGYPLIALIIRGDHELNYIKVERLPQVAIPLKFASKEEIYLTMGVNQDYLGPINMPLPIIIDHSVALMSDFAAGANKRNKYLLGINWDRDLTLPKVADLRKVVNGDLSPDGKGILQVKKGTEIGHIFQLGSKYSDIMKATVQNEKGKNKTLIMGCYGIGITRIVATTIEQNHDEKGIIWPEAIAPFNIAIIAIGIHKFTKVKTVAENIYNQLQIHNIDVLFDDRKEHPGIMFKDIELIGIPHQLIISNKNLNAKIIEYKNRRTGEKKNIEIKNIINFLINKIAVFN